MHHVEAPSQIYLTPPPTPVDSLHVVLNDWQHVSVACCLLHCLPTCRQFLAWRSANSRPDHMSQFPASLGQTRVQIPPAKLMFLDCSIVFSSLTGIPDSSSLLCLTAWGCGDLCDSTTCVRI